VRVLVDAVGCTFGGIATYEANLLSSWVAEFPDDELLVVLGDDDTQPPDVGVLTISFGRPDVLTRPFAVTRAMRRAARTFRPDAVLALRPATTLRSLEVPLAVVVHDLRHELRPDQFSRGRRAIRWASYGRSYALADGFVCISQRTKDDLVSLHPKLRGKPSAVVHHGADHVDGWLRGDEHYVVAFGHHTNKNVDLVLAAWQRLVAAGKVTPAGPTLNIFGLSSTQRAALAEQVRARGLDDVVLLSEYLAEDAYQARMSGADVVLYPSDFEGFGIPVVEAMRLGVPVVVGPDPAVQEVAAGHAFAMREWTDAALAAAITEALDAPRAAIDEARTYAQRFTWSATVRQTRDFLAGLSAGGTASSG
jgi:glycosyltransferase involved in cell wall biosynthesis